jgi:hypothetical protein
MILMAVHKIMYALEYTSVRIAMPSLIQKVANFQKIKSPVIVAVPTTVKAADDTRITLGMTSLGTTATEDPNLGMIGQIMDASRASYKLLDIIKPFFATDCLTWFVSQHEKHSYGFAELSVYMPFSYTFTIDEKGVRICGVAAFRTNSLVGRQKTSLRFWRAIPSPKFSLSWINPNVFSILHVVCQERHILPPALDNTVLHRVCRELWADIPRLTSVHDIASLPDDLVHLTLAASKHETKLLSDDKSTSSP